MDYIFYRIHFFYNKKDHIPVMMGIYFLFVLELSLLFFSGIVFNLSTGGMFSGQFLNKNTFWMIFTGIVLLLFIFNIFRYFKKGKVDSIVKQFENSNLNKRIKTWQIFIIPILIVVFSFLLIVVVK